MQTVLPTVSMDEVCVLLGRKDIEIYLGLKREAELNEVLANMENTIKQQAEELKKLKPKEEQENGA